MARLVLLFLLLFDLGKLRFDRVRIVDMEQVWVLGSGLVRVLGFLDQVSDF